MVGYMDRSQSSTQATPKGRQAGPSADGQSLSPSTASSSPDDGETGVRIADLNLQGTPSHRRVSVKQEGGSVQGEGSIPDPSAQTVTFQIGKPSGDMFVSPVKDDMELRSVSATDMGRRLGSGHLLSTPITLPSEPYEALEQRPSGPVKTLRYRSSDISGNTQCPSAEEVDAQGIYPQSACVFVANLPEARDDRALEAALTREFCKYGTVFVKIRRDAQNMPFAFCQYTTDDAACEAMEQGRGTLILGRACRTEMVKANRSYLVQRRGGGDLTVGQVYTLMEPYGKLDKCETAGSSSTTDGPSILVQFKMYDATRDLATAFRDNEQYRVVAVDPAGRSKVRPKNSNEAFMLRYEVDRRSVFVDGLQGDLNKEELVAVFEETGEVLDVQIIKRSTSSGLRVYAFVEFSQFNMPELAIKRFHNTIFHGNKLRVERKLGRQPFRTPRRVQSQTFPTYHSPGYDSPTHLTAPPRGGAVVTHRAPSVMSPRAGLSLAQRSTSSLSPPETATHAPSVDSMSSLPSGMVVNTSLIGDPGGYNLDAMEAPPPADMGLGFPSDSQEGLITGQTPVRGPAYAFPQMAYGGQGYANAMPYFPPTPQLPTMNPWVLSPGWPYYPYASPPAMPMPAVMTPEDTTEEDIKREQSGKPATE